jgi:hypothetical protein
MTEPEQTAPLADVYADDIASVGAPGGRSHAAYSFAVEADADPDAFARVAGVLTVSNLLPRAVTLRREGQDLVSMAIKIGPLGHVMADMIRRKLLQLTCVISVDMEVLPDR